MIAPVIRSGKDFKLASACQGILKSKMLLSLLFLEISNSLNIEVHPKPSDLGEGRRGFRVPTNIQYLSVFKAKCGYN